VANPARWARLHPRPRSWQSHPPQATRFVLLAILSVAAAVGVIASPVQAQDPEAIEAELDERWNELRPIAEELNGIREDLRARRKDARELEEELAPLELRVDVARTEVSDIAAYSYKGGNVTALNALLTTGSPTAFADRLAILDQFARVQREEISQVIDVMEEYEAEQAELDAVLDELTAEEEDLAERVEDIEAEIDELEEARAAAYEESGAGNTQTGSGDCPATYPGGAAATAIEFACAQLGKPYQFGAAGPDAFDCSGLTSAAWAAAGVTIPHQSAGQRDAVAYIDEADLIPGDLVFYYSDISHVAIYAGGGMIVQASQPGVPLNMAPLHQQPVHSYGRV
jgi:cell wall-associated NlpC family hydrolase